MQSTNECQDKENAICAKEKTRYRSRYPIPSLICVRVRFAPKAKRTRTEMTHWRVAKLCLSCFECNVADHTRNESGPKPVRLGVVAGSRHKTVDNNEKYSKWRFSIKSCKWLNRCDLYVLFIIIHIL
jgi:hypothetical protein